MKATRIVRSRGFSMEPTILAGDFIIVTAVQKVEVGDVLLFEDEQGSQVVHRLIWIDPWGGCFEAGDHKRSLTKGSRCRRPPGEIKGRAIGLVRNHQIIELGRKNPDFKQRIRLGKILCKRSAWHIAQFAKQKLAMKQF